MKLQPYLTLPGNAEEAMDFYARALGGRVTFVQRYREVPSDQYPTPAGWEEKIMHANIKGDDFELMVADSSPDHPATFGNATSIIISPDSVERGGEVFRALSEGGRVTMDYRETFWGATFGMCVDRFGISWMVNAQERQTRP